MFEKQLQLLSMTCHKACFFVGSSNDFARLPHVYLRGILPSQLHVLMFQFVKLKFFHKTNCACYSTTCHVTWQ